MARPAFRLRDNRAFVRREAIPEQTICHFSIRRSIVMAFFDYFHINWSAECGSLDACKRARCGETRRSFPTGHAYPASEPPSKCLLLYYVLSTSRYADRSGPCNSVKRIVRVFTGSFDNLRQYKAACCARLRPVLVREKPRY